MKAIVDQDTCIGCTLCVQTCPQVFKMQDDKAVSYVDTIPEAVIETAKKAAVECPVDAIRIEE